MRFNPDLFEYFFDKMNTRSASALGALVLIFAGIYMCFRGLISEGSINLKTAVMEGRIETGSLGILAMFLGVAIILALNLARPYDGQQIKLVMNGKEIVGRGLSHRKMVKLVEAASTVASCKGTAPEKKIYESDTAEPEK